MRRSGMAFVGLVLLGGASCQPNESAGTDSTGATPAPPYTAVSMQGDTVSLKSQEGNVVLLNIWATYCIPCREEMPFLQKLAEKESGRGLRIVGVSVDARGAEDRINRFVKEVGVTFPIWLDPDERASFVFRAIGVPATYLISRDGKIVWRKLGPIDAKDAAFSAALERELGRS